MPIFFNGIFLNYQKGYAGILPEIRIQCNEWNFEFLYLGDHCHSMRAFLDSKSTHTAQCSNSRV